MESERQDLKEQILKERMDVLDYQVKLWDSNCKICTKIPEAIQAGILRKGVFKDRPNAICDACPVQADMLSIGKKLTVLLSRESRLRKG